ncbi:MAG: O-antigen ligase family protein [Candidatus Omnitrophota bacterium]
MVYDKLIELGLIGLIIFCPLAYGAIVPWAIAGFEIIAGLITLSWIFKMIRKGTLKFAYNPLVFFMLLFILYGFLQLNFSPHNLGTVYPWATKTELLKIIAYGLIFFVTINTVKTKSQITRILSVIIGMGFFMSIFFLMRYLGVSAPRGFINPDHFCAYLAMIIPLSLGFLFTSNTQSPEKQVYASRAGAIRYLVFFSVIVMSAALFFTMSRGGIFSFIAALMVMAVLVVRRQTLKSKKWVLSAIVVVMIIAIAWLGAAPVVERILSVTPEITSLYFGGRLPIWQGTLQIISDHPIFGSGLGTFNDVFPKYQPVEIIAKHYTHAHSDILQFISETGIPFFILSIICGLWSLFWIFRRFQQRHNPWVISMAVGIFGALTSICLHSFTDFSLHIPANTIILSIILAIVPVVLCLRQDKFGKERVSLNKVRFRFLKAYTGKQDKPGDARSRVYQGIFYTIGAGLLSLYIFTAICPALADYYFQKAADSPTNKNDVPQYSIPNTQYTIRNTQYSIPNTQYSIPNTQYAIQLDPTNAAYHYALAKMLSKNFTTYPLQGASEMQNTIYEFKKAAELNPTNAKYYQSLAWTYGILADQRLNTQYSILNTQLAQQHFQQAIQLEPNNPYRHRTYAIYCFNQAGEINSNTAKDAGAVELKEKLLNTAIREYGQAVKIRPDFSREALEKYFPFTQNYLKLKRILPDLPQFHLILAEFLQDKDVWRENETVFKLDMDRAFDKTPYYIALARWQYKSKNYDQAFSILYDYLKSHPNNAQVHFTIADFAFYGKGDFARVFKEASKAIELEPENIHYRYWHAKWLFYRHRYADAASECKKILALKPIHKATQDLLKECENK